MRSSSPWKEDRIIFRHTLRAVRKESGLVQIVLADKLGLPQSYISKVERGDRKLDIVELREWCHACGIDLQSFVRRFELMLEGKI